MKSVFIQSFIVLYLEKRQMLLICVTAETRRVDCGRRELNCEEKLNELVSFYIRLVASRF